MESCSRGPTDCTSARMTVNRSLAKTIPLWCLLCLASCSGRLSRTHFQVIPHSPQYLLQSPPDAHRTPFTEVLRAYNGFEAEHAWIDLKPSMELRIENAYYEAGAPRSGLAGFLGTEVARYAVLPDGLDLLSVQSMKNRPNDDSPVQDLISTAARSFSHYRLYFEIVFMRSDHPHGSVLLGADSQEEIDGLSGRLMHPETVCDQPFLHCTVFPEACSVSVEIRVVVNGKAESVVWGSTLGNIAKRPHRLQMKRLYAGRLRPIRLDPNDPKVLLLPLLPGDQIVWQ